MSGDQLNLDAVTKPFRWLIGHESTRTRRDWGPRWQVLALRWTQVLIIAGPATLLAVLLLDRR